MPDLIEIVVDPYLGREERLPGARSAQSCDVASHAGNRPRGMSRASANGAAALAANGRPRATALPRGRHRIPAELVAQNSASASSPASGKRWASTATRPSPSHG